jgi:branched-chain amino acid transport system substrate-binding protein
MSCEGWSLLAIAVVCAAPALWPAQAVPQTVVKIGLISSYSGFVAQAADQAQKGIDLYVKEHEKDLPSGVKIEILRRDDTANPEVGKRLAQELIGRDDVQVPKRLKMCVSPSACAGVTRIWVPLSR